MKFISGTILKLPNMFIILLWNLLARFDKRSKFIAYFWRFFKLCTNLWVIFLLLKHPLLSDISAYNNTKMHYNKKSNNSNPPPRPPQQKQTEITNRKSKTFQKTNLTLKNNVIFVYESFCNLSPCNLHRWTPTAQNFPLTTLQCK